MKNRGLEGKNIRLVSCGAGAVDSGIANSVADRLNISSERSSAFNVEAAPK